MADNRIYLYCPVCKEYTRIGKVLYDCNIYTPTDNDETKELQWHRDTFKWMSEHFLKCYGDRFYAGKLFEVITEYDERIK